MYIRSLSFTFEDKLVQYDYLSFYSIKYILVESRYVEFELTDGISGEFLLHRIDGPVIEFSNGYKEYYLNGYRMDEDDYWDQIYLIKNNLESYK